MKSEAGASPEENGRRQWQLGEFIVDEQRRSVSSESGSQTLTDLTWRLLLRLIEAAPDSLSSQQLAKQVWQRSHVSNEALAQRVRQLRQILSDDVRSPDYIRTLRGNGYQLIPQPKVIKPTATSKKHFTVATLVVGTLVAVAGFLILKPGQEAEPSQADVLSARADEYRLHVNNESNDIAIRLYREALEADPYNVDALVGYSLSLSNAVSKFGQTVSNAGEAAALADRALALQPDASSALAARGFAEDVQGRVSEAISYYQMALETDPDNRSAKASLAYLLQIRGDLHAGLNLDAEAYAAEPSAYFTEMQISSALYLAGLPERSAAWLDKASTMRPDNVFLADARARRLWVAGEKEAALELLLHAPSDRSGRVALIATLQWALDQTAAARGFARADELAANADFTCILCLAFRLKENQPGKHEFAESSIPASQWPEAHVDLAALQLARGQIDEAHSALARAVSLGYRDWRWLQAHPFLLELKTTTRFEALISQIRQLSDTERRKILSDPSLIPIVQGPGESRTGK